VNESGLLDPGLMGRLERLQLATRRPLAGRFIGERRSPRRGSSMDFADHREYHPGDDHRRIDHHLFARLDLLFVKLFEAEDDLTVRLLIDASASMGLHGKLDCAKRAAAALGFLALQRRNAVSVHTLPDLRAPARFNNPTGLAGFLQHLGDVTAGGPTNFGAAAADLLRRPGPAGVTIVLSDLLSPEWEHALRRLPARGSDVSVIQILCPEDLSPPGRGDLELIDTETGHRVPVALSDDVVEAYAAQVDRWLDDISAGCRRADAAHVMLGTDEDLESALIGSWREAGVLS